MPLLRRSRFVLALQLVSAVVGSAVVDHPLALCAPTQRLYVVTVDGEMLALDWEGHSVWSHQFSGPLFSSTLNYQVEVGEPTLIPGLDRVLYKWDGFKLEELEVMADDLVDKSFPYREGVALAGAKFREVEAINSASGELVYQCSAVKCSQPHDQMVLHKSTQVLKASTYRVTVRLAEEISGEEVWNFTVGEVELSLVGGNTKEEGEEEVESQEEEKIEASQTFPLRVDAARGIVYAVKEDQTLWQHQMTAPITAMWVQDGHRLIRVNLSRHSVLPKGQHGHPALMMVYYNDKYYIQPMPLPSERSSFHFHPPAVYRVTIVEEMAQSEGEKENSHQLALYQRTNLLDLYNKSLDKVSLYFAPEDQNNFQKDDNFSEEVCSPSSNPTFLVESWWDLVIRKSVALAKYLVFGVFLVLLDRLHHKYGRSRILSRSEVQESEEVTNNQTLLKKPSTESTIFNTTITVTGSLSNGFRRHRRIDSMESRFGSDYELRGRLGKGGFGVVYHVKNRTDDGEYAVKRIRLPRRKSARVKVMREVHALAQLDHPKIVRYFHSWVEQAPEGWQQQEHWVPLSRRESYAFAEHSPFPATCTMPSSQLLPSYPSFSLLSHSNIHSEVPPPLASASNSSSFVIEFRDRTGEENIAKGTDEEDKEEEDEEKGERDGGKSEEGEKDEENEEERREEEEEDDEGEENKCCFPRVLMDNRDDLSQSSLLSDDDDENDRDQVEAEPPTYLFIQMQLCQKESLKDWLTKNIRNRPRRTVAEYFQQVLDAVAYVHLKGLMHRDLKPSNIFFSLEGSVKVGDFGLVTGSIFTGSQGSLSALNPLAEESVRHTGNIGSHFYMGPEQAAGKKYDQKVDIYSLGVIYFELHFPFDTEMERVKVLENIRQKQIPKEFLSNMPQETMLVMWLMETQPSKRPTAAQIQESELFDKLCISAAQSPDFDIIAKY